MCYGRCALANECILRDVQLLENMLNLEVRRDPLIDPFPFCGNTGAIITRGERGSMEDKFFFF